MLINCFFAFKPGKTNMGIKSDIYHRLYRISWLGNVRFAINYLEFRGLKALLRKLLLKIFGFNKTAVYNHWIKVHEPGKYVLMRQGKKIFKIMPRIVLVVMMAEENDRTSLHSLVQSLSAQTYGNWELFFIIPQGHSGPEFKDQRAKNIYYSATDTGNSPKLLVALLKGDFVGFVLSTDIFAPFALHEIVLAINNNPDVDCLYSDHDQYPYDRKELRSDPYFKPDWSPDLLRSYNYIGHLLLMKRGLFEKIEQLNTKKNCVDTYDLALKATERAGKIVHISKILYHVQSTADLFAYDKCKRVSIEKHLQRIGLEASVENGLLPDTYNVMYHFNHKTKVSIIIPNKDHHLDLEKCIKSIITMSTYSDYEICVVENGSVEKETFDLYEKLTKDNTISILEWKMPFNYSSINNFAVANTDGEVILFLNNDTEVINSDWLERMLEHALRKDVGAVGAKLYYPDGTIQHAGVVVSIGGVADHAFKGFGMGSPGYFGNLKTIRNVSAVTAACLMTRREVFNEVDGFDESLVVAYNDVDFCLRLRAEGYLIIWTPFAELYHHEYKTRRYPSTSIDISRERRERKLYQKKWRHVLRKSDPYYNQNLKYEKADFSTGMS
jgi:GT2 family glycosyltransferase